MFAGFVGADGLAGVNDAVTLLAITIAAATTSPINNSGMAINQKTGRPCFLPVCLGVVFPRLDSKLGASCAGLATASNKLGAEADIGLVIVVLLNTGLCG